MEIINEAAFETAILRSLVDDGGYKEIPADQYSPEHGIFKYEFLEFLKESQSDSWAKLEAIHGEDSDNRVVQRIEREFDLRGSLDVFRNGFTDYGVHFDLAYFEPETGLNEDTVMRYGYNRLCVTRQVHYSARNRNSVDLVLVLNGIPFASMELKNHFTGQHAKDAKRQYATDRDKRELLFSFNKRALVHFAVDSEAVYMTTRINGKGTRWLPFNKGNGMGAGNPLNENGYKTSYLWEEVLKKSSWLEILQRFLHLEVEEINVNGKIQKKEKLIFPRYHQLDAVRKLVSDAREKGAGENYLIQHSAGSGKSNTIAWLSYRLAGLHNENDERIFDSVIVVTDRRVLDSQLQNTIYQFDHKSGVVQKIDKNSQQLADSLTKGKHIIITTLQKFPFVLEKVSNLAERKYAVIIDEAHSSQGGEASKKLKEALAAKSLEAAIDNDNETEDAEDEINRLIELSAAARGRQKNISFFAFTATPKFKTLGVFGHHHADGKPYAFHLYSMRQAIEEGFIMDVLEHYTTYKLYFKLSKAIEEDPELNKHKAAKAIGRFVSLHPHNLAQKTEIIIEHFKQVSSKQIGGKAKAMVVTGSRLHALRYYEEFCSYIKEKGYDDIRVLVAFSGKVIDEKYPEGVTEPELTGFGERELARRFDSDEYKILIVADKYQTGFDQPLLHTMYVDKKLSGVKAVQTLSRLNRIYPGKESTFILDFVNDEESILASFQPYYEKTSVKEEPNPNHLYDLRHKLDGQGLYDNEEIDAVSEIYFKKSSQLTHGDQGKLYAIIDLAVARYEVLESEDEQDEFKKSLRTWCSLYAFLAQIMPFRDAELEKFYAYGKLLYTRLPKKSIIERLHLNDEVAMEYYRMQKMREGALELEKDDGSELDGLSEAGIKRAKEEKANLSEIIEVINDRFGTDFTDADRLFFDQIETELMRDETLKTQAKVNEIDTFKYAFEDLFVTKLIERMDQNRDIFEKILGNEAFGGLVRKIMMESVYRKLNA